MTTISSKQGRNINRQATTKYLKNKEMHRNYQNGSMLHPARYNSYDGPKEVIEKTQCPPKSKLTQFQQE
jgi:hypothetical protein